MTIVIPISELKQRTGKVLNKAVVEQKDVVIEKYGQEYAVVLSLERYQELLDAAQSRVREQFLKAQKEVYAVTNEIPAEEMDEIVSGMIRKSRVERVTDASGS